MLSSEVLSPFPEGGCNYARRISWLHEDSPHITCAAHNNISMQPCALAGVNVLWHSPSQSKVCSPNNHNFHSTKHSKTIYIFKHIAINTVWGWQCDSQSLKSVPRIVRSVNQFCLLNISLPKGLSSDWHRLIAPTFTQTYKCTRQTIITDKVPPARRCRSQFWWETDRQTDRQTDTDGQTDRKKNKQER